MQSVGTTSAEVGAAGNVFVTGVSGVAALDTPQLTQTKQEIRSIVAEIAEFSASQMPRAEFLNAVLPRIASAMGATAVALWHCTVDSQVELVGEHHLPECLLTTRESSDREELLNHSKILICIATEGSAVLVPPKSVRVAAERPINPLDESLLVVPIKIDDRFEMLLEVIQPASGGPAAQRGYLRFVAQMADLMADFLRRARLHHYAGRAAYVQLLQDSLLAISSARDLATKYQRAATSLAQLLDADLVMLIKRRRMMGWSTGWRVQAISHVATFDARSEIAMTAERLMASRAKQAASSPGQFTLLATDQLTSEEATDHDDVFSSAWCAEHLRNLIGCAHLAQMALSDSGECQMLVALDSSCDLKVASERTVELASAFRTLLPEDEFATNSRAAKAANQSGWTSRLERFIVRASTILLVLAVAFFPTPDNISSIAVLESVDKELYYAPSSATVEQVFVDTHEPVKRGSPLVQLFDSQLQSQLDELQGQRNSTQLQLEESLRDMKRGGQAPNDAIQLSFRVDQLRNNLKSIDDRLDIVEAQNKRLRVVARRDATVTSWDARNQLSGRPVSAGQLLLTTYQPNAPWQLRLSIPERQLGRLREAMAGSRDGLAVQFSLSSHPSEVQHGRLITISDQLIKDDDGSAKAMGIVAIDGNKLPSKSDGAVARATVACGRTFAIWLAVRDAYHEVSAWWRLNR